MNESKTIKQGCENILTCANVFPLAALCLKELQSTLLKISEENVNAIRHQFQVSNRHSCHFINCREFSYKYWRRKLTIVVKSKSYLYEPLHISFAFLIISVLLISG